MNGPLFAALLLTVSIVSFVKSQSYETLNSKKVVKFYVHISPIFSCWVTIILNCSVYVYIVETESGLICIQNLGPQLVSDS